MLVSPFYAISENFLPYHVCDNIIQTALAKKTLDGEISSGTNKQIRNSRVVWLKDMWIYDWIDSAVYTLNNQLGWNFNVTEPEDIQFTIYKEGQFYGWHQDTLGHDEIKNFDSDRKISVVIPLADSSAYEGGDLEFYDSSLNPMKQDTNKIVSDKLFRLRGNLIIFPSYVYHRVTSVTKGERYSMVIWYRGEQWK